MIGAIMILASCTPQGVVFEECSSSRSWDLERRGWLAPWGGAAAPGEGAVQYGGVQVIFYPLLIRVLLATAEMFSSEKQR